MFVYVNKETFEVINDERFDQLVNELLFNSDNIRIKDCYDALETTWTKVKVTEAEVKAPCNHKNCMYYVNAGCGAPLIYMAGCPKTRKKQR